MPTPDEVARACAVMSACQPISGLQKPGFGIDSRWSYFDCLDGTVILFEPNAAERVVPLMERADSTSFNESWAFFLREVLSAGSDCDAIARILTVPDVSIGCQEDGCWLNSKGPAAVTCDGNIAEIAVDGKRARRDCSRAGMRCDEGSATGCTDRPLTRCKKGGADRCDGDIKLGCDSCGFVSFHDCSWNGGHCEEVGQGAKCVPPENAAACAAMPLACNGERFSMCVAGEPVEVDCAALGDFRCSVPDGCPCSAPDAGAGPLNTSFVAPVCSKKTAVVDAGTP